MPSDVKPIKRASRLPIGIKPEAPNDAQVLRRWAGKEAEKTFGGYFGDPDAARTLMMNLMNAVMNKPSPPEDHSGEYFDHVGQISRGEWGGTPADVEATLQTLLQSPAFQRSENSKVARRRK